MFQPLNIRVIWLYECNYKIINLRENTNLNLNNLVQKLPLSANKKCFFLIYCEKEKYIPHNSIIVYNMKNTLNPPPHLKMLQHLII